MPKPVQGWQGGESMSLSVSFNRTKGFTLVELMIAIVILAILASIAAPSFVRLIASQRVRAAAFDLHGDLSFARSEAIKRNSNVTFSPKNTSDWKGGWDVKDASSNVLKTQQALSGNLLATGGAGVTFGGAGRPSTTLSVTVKDDSLPTTDWRCVSMDLSGRVSSKAGACS